MSELVLVAAINAHPGAEARLQEILLSLVAPSRKEAGCLRYDLHRDPADPGAFVFLEAWASPEAHQAHKETPHFREARAAQEGLVASRHLRILERV